MSYLTNYTLDVIPPQQIRNPYPGPFQTVEQVQQSIAVTDGPDDPFDDIGQWDSHDKDMRDLSRKLRGYILVLTGEGEENPDYWRTYYLNGLAHTVCGELTYPEFDSSLLVC